LEEDASSHFADLRRKDKAAYQKRKAELGERIGIEAAKRPHWSVEATKDVMVSSLPTDDSEEEKRRLVERLKAMEAAEEHDDMFDKPTAFG